MDTVIQIGQTAPDFALPDLDGGTHRLEDQRGKVVILNFWSAECPWAERGDRELLAHLAEWGEDVLLWSIASNANETIGLLQQVAAERCLPVVLVDENQEVADLYGAQTTPHLFVIDPHGVLRYQGALDDVNFRKRQPTRDYLREAVEAVLAGQQPDPSETQPYGCSIMRYASW